MAYEHRFTVGTCHLKMVVVEAYLAYLIYISAFFDRKKTSKFVEHTFRVNGLGTFFFLRTSDPK
jgi:hypothetical protein